MKRLLAAVAVLAALLLFGPLVVGVYVQHSHQQFAAELEEQNPLIHAEQISYQRGWFSSQSVYLLQTTFNLPASADRPANPLAVTVSTRSHHGPLPFAALRDNSARFLPALATMEYRLGLRELLAKAGDRLQADVSDPVIRGYSDLLNRYRFNCDVPAGAITVLVSDLVEQLAGGAGDDANAEPAAAPAGPEAITLAWQPLECSGSRGKLSANIDAKWPLVTAKIDNQIEVSMRGLVSSTKVTELDSELPLSSGTIDIEQVRTAAIIPASDGEPALDMTTTNSGIQIVSNAKRDGDAVDLSLSYTVADSQSPMVTATGSFSHYSIHGADRDALISLRQQVVELLAALVQPDVDIAEQLSRWAQGESLWAMLSDAAAVLNRMEMRFGAEQYRLQNHAAMPGVLPRAVLLKPQAKLFTTNLVDGVPLGGYKFGFDSLAIDFSDSALATDAVVKSMRLDNLRLADKIAASDEVVSLQSNWQLAGLQIDGERWLSEAQYQSTLTGLDKAAADQLATLARSAFRRRIQQRIEQAGLPSPYAGLSEEALAAMSFDELMALEAASELPPPPAAAEFFADPETAMKTVMELLRNVRFELNALKFMGQQGGLSASGLLTLASVDEKPVPSPMALLAQLEGGAELAIDKSLVAQLMDLMWRLESGKMPNDMPAEQLAELRGMVQGQLAGMIEQFVAQGLLRDTAGQYRLSADLRARELRVNDNAVPLPFFAQ